MKVLVIGSGGREHALCWQLKRHSPGVELYCAPGNAGIAREADLVPIRVDEIQALTDFAADLDVELTIVGPELPLALGIVDEFRERGLPIFGPDRGAARLETSKVFAKEFMRRHDIPTGDFEVAHDAAELEKAAKPFGFPVVLKADGLASGKGVLIVHDRKELDEAGRAFFVERRFGSSGDRVLVERFLTGEEVSFLGLCDGQRLLPFATCKDYKRIGDGDTGPNTGGMGAHSPSGVVGAGDAREVLERVMNRTLSAMREEGRPFVGVLYAGLMLTDAGPRVLEYNVRFGDPEAQALMLRVSDDLAKLLRAGVDGDFGVPRLNFRREAAACVVLAAAGYPGTPETGAAIDGLDVAASQPDVEIFHAATAEVDGAISVAGGRVINACATGRDLRTALRRAYAAANEIRWPGRQLRSDIGRSVLEAETIQESGILSLPRELRRRPE